MNKPANKYAPPRYVYRLTLYDRLGRRVADEPGNNASALVSHALAMVAEGSAKFWRIGNFAV